MATAGPRLQPRSDFLSNPTQLLRWSRRLACALLLAWPVVPHFAAAAPPVQQPVPGATQATQQATSAPPKVYIGVFKENTVAVLDTQTNQVRSTIPVPPGPHGLVITPDGRKVYVSSDGASTVSVIDTNNDQVVSQIEVGANPHGLAISPDGRRVLVAGFGSNQVVLIDTGTDQVVGRIPVPMPHNSAISPDGHTAYVGSQQQGATAVVILDLARNTQAGQIPLEKTPRALTLNQDATQLYVTLAGTNAVQVLDVARRQALTQIPVGASPHLVVMVPNSSVGLAVSQGPGTLEFLDLVQHTAGSPVQVGTTPHWVAVSSDARTAYVTNEGANSVSVVDLGNRTVTATIPVGNAPRKIVVQPGAGMPVSTSSATPPAAHGTLTIADHGTVQVSGHKEVELEADDYYFAPTFLQGTPGQRLTLELENESGTLHNFSLPEQHIDVDIPPKGKATVAVVFPQSGTLRFLCKFHEALGMHGALHIDGPSAPPLSQTQGSAPYGKTR